MASDREILLIGATGAFGSRLAGHLARLEGTRLVVTSRSLRRATELAARLARARVPTPIEPMAFDHRTDSPTVFARRRPWLVIDAAGPFQGAGQDTARRALEAGAHWIDLADASDYILRFGAALNDLAVSKNSVALTGASTTPALTAAVVGDLTRHWKRIDTLDIAILPAGAGDVGRSVIEAILSYAGNPIAVWQEGRQQTTVGWGRAQRWYTERVGTRCVSPVETPDAVLLSSRFGVTSRIAVHAGLESRLEQFGLLALASARRCGLLASLTPLAPLLHRLRSVTRLLCSDVGGMEVRAAGLDATGQQTSVSWRLIAEQGHGPHVPVLPALAMTRALLAGALAPGARPATDVVDLAMIEAEMRPLAIRTARGVFGVPAGGLFASAMGPPAFASLPRAVKRLHDLDGPCVWTGRADVDVGANPIARISRRLFGLPIGGRDIPVTLSIDRQGPFETWTRNFGGRRFHSRLRLEQSGISEQFGPLRFLLRLTVTEEGIRMPLYSWRLGSLPMPRALAPISDTREYQDEQRRFCFDVRVSLPLFGLLAHYRGWLVPSQSDDGGSVV